MTRRFRGYFRPNGRQPHPDLHLVGRPTIDVLAAYSRRRTTVSFMIDTGADLTIVRPEDSLKVLGDDYDFASIPLSRTVPMSGIGPNVIRTYPQRVGLMVVDEVGEEYRFAQTILFAIPQSGTLGRWRVPSVLG